MGPTGVHAAPVERDRRAGPCLGDDEARAVAELAARVEELFDAPQDVEWAIAEEAAPGAGLDPGRSPLVLNDHSDPAYDGDVLRRLTTRHTATVALLDRGTGLAPGLAGFGERLTEAVPAVTAGHPEWFVAPTADSYYHVWMELHEHLLSAFSRTRGEGDA